VRGARTTRVARGSRPRQDLKYIRVPSKTADWLAALQRFQGGLSGTVPLSRWHVPPSKGRVLLLLMLSLWAAE